MFYYTYIEFCHQYQYAQKFVIESLLDIIDDTFDDMM